MKCRICQNEIGNKNILFQERMFGTFEEFDYIQCSECGCLQIAVEPSDMSGYYPSNYYSFADNANTLHRVKNRIENWILKCIALKSLGIFSYTNFVANQAVLFKEHWEHYFEWLDPEYVNLNSGIVDIGCGSGVLLERLANTGFQHLYGIDPFIKEDIRNEKYHIDKKDLFSLTGTFDFIMLHHSFEHMSRQHDILEKLKSCLTEEGTILIRIPLADSFVYKEYGMNWFQLDVPRHFYLHTVKSLGLLANMHGLSIEKIVYDSTGKQFVYSERYKKGLKLQDNSLSFTKEQNKQFRQKANDLNSISQGDQACFFLKRKEVI